MAASKLAIEHLNKSFSSVKGFEKVEILSDISFSVDEGEVVSLVGPTGCGKTTLLRIIDGIIKPDSGRVLIDGKEVNGGKDSSCAMVFQNFNLLPWRSAIKNVEFGLESKGLEKEKIRKISEDRLELVGLRGYEKYHPHELSGGMQQRVGLARALAVNPKVVLFDEPFGSVDILLRESLQEEVLKILLKTKKTAIFVTHNVEEAIFLSDRIITLWSKPGRIKNIYNVTLPRPRGLEMENSEESNMITRKIREDLRESLRQSQVRVPDASLPVSNRS